MTLPEIVTNERDGSLLRLIAAGEFTMGSTREQVEAAIAMDKEGPQFGLRHETPQFRAPLDDFYLGIYAVTNEQFARFLSVTKPSQDRLQRWVSWLDRIDPQPNEHSTCLASPEFKTHPVINVTWFGAEAYCRWAEVRLPTEIEWEKAARGSDGRIFPWGNDWDRERLSWWGSHDAKQTTSPVDAFAQGCSSSGIYQMAGNVEEWCFLPSEFLARGVVLIDTPGVGSTHRHNSATAGAVLPECDATLFVVSPDPLITALEIECLARIRQTVAHLTIVLNKIDTLRPNERSTAMTFLWQVFSIKSERTN